VADFGGLSRDRDLSADQYALARIQKPDEIFFRPVFTDRYVRSIGKTLFKLPSREGFSIEPDIRKRFLQTQAASIFRTQRDVGRVEIARVEGLLGYWKIRVRRKFRRGEDERRQAECGEGEKYRKDGSVHGNEYLRKLKKSRNDIEYFFRDYPYHVPVSHFSDMDASELIERINRDPEAFSEVVDAYADKLLRYVVRIS
jgi:hypothetical protein